MDLQPVYADEKAAAIPGPGIHDDAIRLDRQQLERLGAETAVVRRGAATAALRSVGRVEVDENRLFLVRAGSNGIITRVATGTETGSDVRAGQPLAVVYGRDYTSAQRNFLYALRASENAPPVYAGQPRDPNALSLEEARRDLLSIGLDAAQINRVERSREVLLDVTLTAPASGTIIARSVFPQQRFDQGAELYRIADLTRVWINADVSGGDDAYLRPGTSARALVQGSPELRAIVTDTLVRYDGEARIARVRLELDNSRKLLKPGMVVDLQFDVILPECVTVPTEAIIDTGRELIVFLKTDDATFEPRTIRTGWRFSDVVEVVDGLAPGETVVVKGAFLLQSEQRIRRGTTGTHD
jgi:Cu(I)/Ag(I) efflux system membrane fusion protein